MWLLPLLLLLAQWSWGREFGDLPPLEEDYDSFSHYRTRPDIEAPKWIIETYDEHALQHGMYWFVAPYEVLNQTTWRRWIGPYIYRPDGELVWSAGNAFNYTNTFDFRPSLVRGNEYMLTWIGAQKHREFGFLYDYTYTPYKYVDLYWGKTHSNFHEFQIINGGKSVLATSRRYFQPKRVDTQGFKGRCAAGWQGFKEVDMETGEYLFEWEAHTHVGLDESTIFVEQTVEGMCVNNTNPDTFHENAIDKFANGDYLLSMKNTNTLYRISHVDGSIVWRLGGYLSDFVFGPEARFSHQHHCRIRHENETHQLISLFNNAIPTDHIEEGTRTDKSYGMLLELRTDVEPMTATAVHRYERPDNIEPFSSTPHTQTRGSMDYLPNGNAIVGWVDHTQISEHSADGRMLMQAMFRHHMADSYRTFKMPWVGRPAEPPDVLSEISQANDGDIRTMVWVSWNGATEVARWEVRNASTSDTGGAASMKLLSSRPTAGFETQISFRGHAAQVIVIAFDARKKELGRSEVITSHNPSNLAPQKPLYPDAEDGNEEERASSWGIYLFALIAIFVAVATFRRGWARRAVHLPLSSKDEHHPVTPNSRAGFAPFRMVRRGLWRVVGVGWPGRGKSSQLEK